MKYTDLCARLESGFPDKQGFSGYYPDVAAAVDLMREAAAAIRELEARGEARNAERLQALNKNAWQAGEIGRLRARAEAAEARVAELMRERDAERERCARIAEDAAPATQDFNHTQIADTCLDIAAAIRKGGEA